MPDASRSSRTGMRCFEGLPPSYISRSQLVLPFLGFFGVFQVEAGSHVVH